MKRKYGMCNSCGCLFSNYSVVEQDLLGNKLCKTCAENANFKALADPKCERCNGNGFTLYHEKNYYPVVWYSDEKIKCPCTDEVKVI